MCGLVITVKCSVESSTKFGELLLKVNVAGFVLAKVFKLKDCIFKVLHPGSRICKTVPSLWSSSTCCLADPSFVSICCLLLDTIVIMLKEHKLQFFLCGSCRLNLTRVDGVVCFLQQGLCCTQYLLGIEACIICEVVFACCSSDVAGPVTVRGCSSLLQYEQGFGAQYG